MMGSREFRDRRGAGCQLATRLAPLRGVEDVIVLALPRGGVPVAFEVARALDAPLAPFLVRKLGVPGAEEFALGAIASGGLLVFDEGLIRRLRIPARAIEDVIARERRELARREAAYDGRLRPPSLSGRTVVLVDDGMATGASMIAAVNAVRAEYPARIIVAVPVASVEAVRAVRRLADEVVCVIETGRLDGVASWYVDFRQTGDDEVRELLELANPAPSPEGSGS